MVWLFPVVVAESDRDITRRRRGWWVRVARERKDMKTDTLAKALGYKGTKAGTIVSRWESGERPIPSDHFPALSVLLDLPRDWLATPPETDRDRLERRISELARDAAALERADFEAGEDGGPGDAGEPPDEPRTRPS